MILARVLGNVVATVRHPDYIGRKVLIVQPLNENYQDINSSFLAVDSVLAGRGDVVLVSREGNTARQLLNNDTAPFHSVILAIVDSVKK